MHQRELAKAHREIALPTGVAGAGIRQPVKNGEAVLIRLQRAGKIAPRHLPRYPAFFTPSPSFPHSSCDRVY
jgi:hypothetical protein